MKKFAFLAVFALAACGEAETEEPMMEEEVVVAEPAAEVAMAADGMPMAGTFEVTNAEGETYTQVVSDDGTYTSTRADGTVTNGTWTSERPDQWCGADEGEEVECATETIDADGVWTSVSDNDPEDVSTVVRVDS
ncbi:hypothetical protein [Aurantiacibacter rhizosphaerae]|uniref:Uncharacterized protein n=1 Tax=Aurantiacibacter rhizosphaerae TaxID=2691582 RepID=A0A844XDA8_9SPHN|nr:hypothetical protein [Aurantiacibacter rhizosphaerae]MWV27672.1 hypothetical protein [Aurantiacibacter rhizosphaerae]